MAVSIQEFEKALQALENTLVLPETDIIRDATIKRFEFCVELSWKTAKKIMGSASTSPKQVIREMAQNGFITDVELWLRSIDERNNSVHTYNESLANQVYQFARTFLPHAQVLLSKFKQSPL